MGPSAGEGGLAAGPFVLSLPAVFSADECARISGLARGDKAGEGGLVGGGIHHNIRRADISWLDDRADAAWVMDRIVSTVAAANRTQFSFDLSDFGERMQVARYCGESGGHYDWHTDIGEGVLAARRKLTMVVQLSTPDSYTGGALELNATGRAVAAPRGQGDAVLFASFVLHRVMPVESGTRASLTLWVHGPAFR